MAIRINVTAVRDCPVAEVRAVMSEVIRPACAGPDCGPVGEQLEVAEHNGWTWFATSVWGVSAGDLNRGLCRLARPALQFTTSDGERWYLSVHGGPQGQVHFVHEFGYHGHDPDPAEDAERQAQLDQRTEPPPVDPRLAFLQDDPPPGSERRRTPFDLIADNLTGVGAHIPDELRAAVAGMPYSRAAAYYRRWHAEQVSAALTAAGIPHDAAAVRSVLLWENITENESGSDLGNLPRLLSVLGLGGQWDECVRQAEAPPPPPEPECAAPTPPPAPPPPPEALVGPVLAITDPLGLTPVAGGPAPLPLKEMALVRFFPEALSIHATAGVVLTVTLPPGSDRTALVPLAEEDAGPVEMTADGFRMGLPNHLFLGRDDLRRLLGKSLARLLFRLPDGAVLDIAFAEQGHPALTQRYRGPVRAGTWQISETYPALTHEVLVEALDLARKADRPRHKARDEAEAEAVVELARHDPNLWDMKVQRKGRAVWCESDIVGHLSKVFFRHRFGAFWDVAAHDREAWEKHRQHLELQRRMRKAGAEAARRRAAPHDDVVLLEGRHGRYWASDFTRLTELEQETRQKIDAAMTELGFVHVGDLVAKKQRDIVLRAYVSTDWMCLGLLMAKRTMYLGYEFFSRFADGSTLTTTTSGAVDSQPEVGSYYKVCPGLEVAALFAKHRWGIERFRTHKGTTPVRLDGTLPGVARELDAALARRASVPS
jgi:hypothetical protein